MSLQDDALTRADKGIDVSLERLFALMRIPSVSTDPAFAGACSEAAKACHLMLTEMGFETTILPTPGHPAVLAHYPGPGRKLLFYGHYDVQPAGDAIMWDNAPFDPIVKGTGASAMISGRGASDNKGQFMTFLEACRALIAIKGGPGADVHILLEGEEETGSPNLPVILDRLAAGGDWPLILASDTSMQDADTPAICTRMRGLLTETISLRVADADLHSGIFGGVAPNAAAILARAFAALHGPDGQVAIPGFYDGLRKPNQAEVDLWPDGGAANRTWTEPSCDIAGISSGYQGEGFSTIIPAAASAKVGFRLCDGQDPLRVQQAFRGFMRDIIAAATPDAEPVFQNHAAVPSVVLPHDSEDLHLVRAALDAEWPNPACILAGGGTIPVVGMFQQILKTPPIMVGFGLADDGAHGANERFSLRCFQKGIRSWIRILNTLATDTGKSG